MGGNVKLRKCLAGTHATLRTGSTAALSFLRLPQPHPHPTVTSPEALTSVPQCLSVPSTRTAA
ncbi:uncharacterized protein BDW43DRAFT_286088 [Aspergillus alliaceus]|uniref:uncharacterized protein n=1 Tax=Petromyces alliaceus TaxID=209559 RepID=UPI0012A4EFEE|nr:uncharacterized protein BDW43DRAFT_286088 [Aspergillus alliaceus]KAB8230316.1 hypothetical protein BDW43DRAFT_286088 [Aspergillus alliaceus]